MNAPRGTDAKAPAHLLLIEGELERQVFDIDPQGLSIGRTAETAICLPASRVSRRHCSVEWSEGSWWLRDLDSRNGTFLNDRAIHVQELRDGDRVRIADWTFLFVDSPATTNEDDAGRVESTVADGRTTDEVSVEDGLYFDPGVLVEIRDKARGGARAPDRAEDGLAGVLRVSRAVGTARSLDELATSLLPLLLESLPAQRAALSLELPGLSPFARTLHRDGATEPVTPSTTITRRVLQDRVAVSTNRVADEAMLQDAASLMTGKVETILAVPLLAEPDRALGMLYIDSTASSATSDNETPGDRTGPLRREHLLWLTAVAGIVAAALPRLRHHAWLEERVWTQEGPVIVGESDAIRRVLETIARIAATDATVLVRGESGTGKELVARELHRASRRRHGPFVAVNCATLSETLLESELLGHERGAFTGAVHRKLGKLEVADGGTLFLDEVGELPPAIQARLLRFLESFEFERVGGIETLRADLRLIAATNRDLEAAIAGGAFRSDLFYRLNVVPLRLPPLRERTGDIALLAHHFLAVHGHRLGRPDIVLSRRALRLLERHGWPGNVRQLSNVIERAIILAPGESIEPEDLEPELVAAPGGATFDAAADGGYQGALDQRKRELILDAVDKAAGNLTEAARSLQLSPNYLHRLIRNLDLRDKVQRFQQRRSST